MAEFEVVREFTLPSSEPGRSGKQDLVVIYTVDRVATRSLTVPQETATPDTVKAAIKAAEAKRPTIAGLKFS